MQYGSKVSGNLKPLFVESLSTSKAGEVYQIQIDVDGIPDAELAIQQLLTLEQQYPDMKILWIDTCNIRNTITMQVTDIGPGSWMWSGVFSTIPSLLLLALIGVIGYLLWQVWQTQGALWLWVLLLLGGGLMVFMLTREYLPPIGQIRKTAKETRRSESPRDALSILSEQRKGYEGILRDVRAELADKRGDLRGLEKKKKKTDIDRSDISSLRDDIKDLEKMQKDALEAIKVVSDEMKKV